LFSKLPNYLLVILCASDIKADFGIWTKWVQSLWHLSFIGNRHNSDLELHPNTMHLWAIYTLLSFNSQNNSCFVYSEVSQPTDVKADFRYCRAVEERPLLFINWWFYFVDFVFVYDWLCWSIVYRLLILQIWWSYVWEQQKHKSYQEEICSRK